MGSVYLPGHATASRRKQKIFNLSPFSDSHVNAFSGVCQATATEAERRAETQADDDDLCGCCRRKLAMFTESRTLGKGPEKKPS